MVCPRARDATVSEIRTMVIGMRSRLRQPVPVGPAVQHELRFRANALKTLNMALHWCNHADHHSKADIDEMYLLMKRVSISLNDWLYETSLPAQNQDE